jgi:protein-S-isoprenylcysteine O-methyltransferase Ste14
MLLKTVSILGFVIMVVATLILLKINDLFGDNVLSIVVQILAVGLMLWARVTFGKRSFHAAGNPTEGRLVTSGPYRYVRHPIYAAVLYFIWPGILTHLSLETVALGLCGIVGVGMRMVVEEKLLRARYPEYGEYANRTKRLIPFLV